MEFDIKLALLGFATSALITVAKVGLDLTYGNDHFASDWQTFTPILIASCGIAINEIRKAAAGVLTTSGLNLFENLDNKGNTEKRQSNKKND